MQTNLCGLQSTLVNEILIMLKMVLDIFVHLKGLKIKTESRGRVGSLMQVYLTNSTREAVKKKPDRKIESAFL